MIYQTYPKARKASPLSVSALVKHEWNDTNVRWDEAAIQAAIVRELRRWNVDFEIGLEGIKLTKGQAAKAKIQGMEPGRVDLRLYFNGARMVHIELKKKNGKTSPAQDEWHERLRRNGFDVRVLKCATPQEGVDRVFEIVDEYEGS